MSDLQGSSTPVPLVDAETAVRVRALRDQVHSIGDAIGGGWSGTSDNRQTGCSLHLKFENKVDVTTTMQFVEMLQQSPAKLAALCDYLLGERSTL